MGTYEWIDDTTVIATWEQLRHTLTFTPLYTCFMAVCEQSGEIIEGHLVEAAHLSTIPSIKIDYKDSVSPLCLLGKKYNVDKSSQRELTGPAENTHCHPYSLFYHYLFSDVRETPLNFCEIGIAEGKSLLMWEEYFPKSQIYGFEKGASWLANWATNHSDRERIHVNFMDVRYDSEIITPLQNTGTLFDCIIDDSSHFFFDMVRIIKCSLQFLKPGGMIIIEDIRKAFDEAWFYSELKDILPEFQTVYFVELDHNRRNSGIIKNDKVLILVKSVLPIFKSVI